MPVYIKIGFSIKVIFQRSFKVIWETQDNFSLCSYVQFDAEYLVSQVPVM